MSWFNSFEGKVDGSPENSFVGEKRLVPNNTRVKAIAKSAKLEEGVYKNGKKYKHYKITFEIAEGEYKGVNQDKKIRPFLEEEPKKTREANFLLCLLMLGNCPANHDGLAPTSQDLMPIVNKVFGIVIREFIPKEPDEDGYFNSINFISEIYGAEGFRSEAGVFLAKKPKVEAHLEMGGNTPSKPIDKGLGGPAPASDTDLAPY